MLIKRYTSLEGLICYEISGAENPICEYGTDTYMELDDCLDGKGNGLFVIGKNQREMQIYNCTLKQAIGFATQQQQPLASFNKHYVKHQICKSKRGIYDKRGVTI